METACRLGLLLEADFRRRQVAAPGRTQKYPPHKITAIKPNRRRQLDMEFCLKKLRLCSRTSRIIRIKTSRGKNIRIRQNLPLGMAPPNITACQKKPSFSWLAGSWQFRCCTNGSIWVPLTGRMLRNGSPTVLRTGARIRVGFIPVTCHLTCPVTHFINENTHGDAVFEPVRFNGWPELKEAFLSGHLEATFLLAPLAMSLREQGVPIKIVYLGHRDGTTMMVHKDSDIRRIEDLRGKTIAIPNRFSNQRLILFRASKSAE